MDRNSNNSVAQRISENCLGVRVRMLSRVLTKIYDDALRPFGVKGSQINILVVTARLGLARPAEICRRLQMDLSTLSRNVDRMRAKGWIELVEDEKDARAHLIRLTTAGRRLVNKIYPAWEQAQEQAQNLLGKTGAEALAKAAERTQAVAR